MKQLFCIKNKKLHINDHRYVKTRYHWSTCVLYFIGNKVPNVILNKYHRY